MSSHTIIIPSYTSHRFVTLFDKFNRTQAIFTLAFLLAIASLALPFVLGAWGVVGILASMVLSIWAIHKSDTTGFVRTSQMRRAFESARHFNLGQVVLLFGLLLVQILIFAYVLVSPAVES